MKNPYKQHSKINPQRAQGNRQISNPVFWALMRMDLNGAEYKCVLAIIDRTWGFGKLSAPIAISLFERNTNLSGRAIQKALAALREKQIIVSDDSKVSGLRGSAIKEYMINKHFDTWLTKYPIKEAVDSLLKSVDNCIKTVDNFVDKRPKG
jgi:phage replication O-like protein O